MPAESHASAAIPAATIGRLTASLLAAAAVLALVVDLVPRRTTIDLGDPEIGRRNTIAGFHEAVVLGGVPARWTAGDAMVVLPARGPLPARVEIVAAGHPDRPHEVVQVTINQVAAGSVTVGPEFETGVVPVVGARPNAHLRISVRSETTPGSDPARPIGICLSRVAVVTGGPERATLAAFVSTAHGLWHAVLIAAFMFLGWSAGQRVETRDGGLLTTTTAVCAVLGGLAAAVGLWVFRNQVVTAGGSLTLAVSLGVALLGLLINPALRTGLEDIASRGIEWPPIVASAARFTRRAEVAWGLAALPLAGLVWLLRTYFVDVIYWDAWEMVPLVEKSYLGTLTFGDLWNQHNEHRVIVPRIVLIGLARLTGWSGVAEVVVNVTLIAAVFAAIGVLLGRWRRDADGAAPLWTFPLLSLLLFSPTQWENWLWSSQFILFLSVASSTLGFLLLAIDRGRPMLFVSSLALGVISSYSFGSGLVYWVAGLAPILLRPSGRGRWLRLLLWTIVGTATIWLYTVGYLPNPHHQPLSASLSSWKDFVMLCDFVATLLGTPVAGYDTDLSWWSGWLGLVFFAVAVARRVWQRSVEPVVWFALALGLAAFGAALLTAIGRVNFGTYAALSSRYVTVVAPFWVAVVLLLADVCREARRPAGRTRPAASAIVRAGSFAVAVVMMVSLLVGWPRALPSWRLWHFRLAPARASLLSDAPDDRLLVRLYPNPQVCRERRAFLQSRHLTAFRQR